jgi:hypothetical protein
MKPILSRRTVLVGGGALAIGVPAIARRAKAAPSASRPSLTIRPGQAFHADSYVHRTLADDEPVDARSELWVASILDQIGRYGGRAGVNTTRFTPPLFVVDADAPTVPVQAARKQDPGWSFPPLEALWRDVPLPADFTPSPGSDAEAIIYQPATGRYWEFWMLTKTGRSVRNSAGANCDEWAAAWGGHISDLSANPGYFETPPDGVTYGTTATGLAMLAGLMTIEEQERGIIDHALHFALPETRKAHWSWPAQRSDGRVAGADAVLQGTIFRLPADLDLEAFGMEPYARMIARAVQRHGMAVRDTAGTVTFYAENPLATGTANPYHRVGGLLSCTAEQSLAACWSVDPLAGFPWRHLVALAAPK